MITLLLSPGFFRYNSFKIRKRLLFRQIISYFKVKVTLIIFQVKPYLNLFENLLCKEINFKNLWFSSSVTFLIFLLGWLVYLHCCLFLTVGEEKQNLRSPFVLTPLDFIYPTVPSPYKGGGAASGDFSRSYSHKSSARISDNLPSSGLLAELRGALRNPVKETFSGAIILI